MITKLRNIRTKEILYDGLLVDGVKTINEQTYLFGFIRLHKFESTDHVEREDHISVPSSNVGFIKSKK